MHFTPGNLAHHLLQGAHSGLSPVAPFPSVQLAAVLSLRNGWGDHWDTSRGWDILSLEVAGPDMLGKKYRSCVRG